MRDRFNCTAPDVSFVEVRQDGADVGVYAAYVVPAERVGETKVISDGPLKEELFEITNRYRVVDVRRFEKVARGPLLASKEVKVEEVEVLVVPAEVPNEDLDS